MHSASIEFIATPSNIIRADQNLGIVATELPHVTSGVQQKCWHQCTRARARTASRPPLPQSASRSQHPLAPPPLTAESLVAAWGAVAYSHTSSYCCGVAHRLHKSQRRCTSRPPHDNDRRPLRDSLSSCCSGVALDTSLHTHHLAVDSCRLYRGRLDAAAQSAQRYRSRTPLRVNPPAEATTPSGARCSLGSAAIYSESSHRNHQSQCRRSLQQLSGHSRRPQMPAVSSSSSSKHSCRRTINN